MMDLRCGNNLDLLPTLPDCSIDACVCDPPYELGFMGRKWDSSGIAYNVDLWRHVLRVLKPGGHLVAFGGTRTYHRMTCAIEDAGFEIRDCLGWLYGSGFPKSLDVSKAIDKAAGAERDVVGSYKGASNIGKGSTNSYITTESGRATDVQITAPATDAARQWQGWGTALKPAWEPAVLARKPLDGTVAANVLAHGCGALNVDGCRVDADERPLILSTASRPPLNTFGGSLNGSMSAGTTTQGRWPANILHDGSDEAEAVFPHTSSGQKHGGKYNRESGIYAGGQHADGVACYADSGSASRFFYSAKTSTWEREAGLDDMPRRTAGELTGRDDGTAGLDSPRSGAGRASNGRVNIHPTVKPVDLMRWLVRLVTPPGGVVLDPFTGSGSTGMAAMLEGFGFVGFELDPHHVEIARRRIEAARKRQIVVQDGKVQASDAHPAQIGLFDL